MRTWQDFCRLNPRSKWDQKFHSPTCPLSAPYQRCQFMFLSDYGSSGFCFGSADFCCTSESLPSSDFVVVTCPGTPVLWCFLKESLIFSMFQFSVLGQDWWFQVLFLTAYCHFVFLVQVCRQHILIVSACLETSLFYLRWYTAEYFYCAENSRLQLFFFSSSTISFHVFQF